jgi:hypothetical protein
VDRSCGKGPDWPVSMKFAIVAACGSRIRQIFLARNRASRQSCRMKSRRAFWDINSRLGLALAEIEMKSGPLKTVAYTSPPLRRTPRLKAPISLHAKLLPCLETNHRRSRLPGKHSIRQPSMFGDSEL